MVNKTPKPMMTRRSTSDLKSKRPKRNISPKNLQDDLVTGLSWREERELKKALYASLQDVRRPLQDERGDDDDDSVSTTPKPGMFHSQSRTSLSSMADSKFMDESSCSVDSFVEKNEPAKQEPKKKKIQAQRKFAMGGANPSRSFDMPSKPKLKNAPVSKLFPVRPKTEDFLTYLCFRGTSVLPPHMDLMNVQKEEPELTNGRSGFTRDSSPASSSSMSHQNEDSMDVSDFHVRMHTPNRKAARASASTPETARGFANLKNGRKRSPLASTPSSRKRLSDTYGTKGKGSIGKGRLADRLALKRKAMATLNHGKKLSPKKQALSHKLKSSQSDGALLKRKDDKRSRSLSSSTSLKQKSSTSALNTSFRKRKSTSDLSKESTSSPRKKQKLRSSERVKLKSKDGKKRKPKYSDSVETHPVKRLSTNTAMASKKKKTFKPHRPMTRAASHLKSALKAAKFAANKKLRMVGRSLPSRKEYNALTKIVHKKKQRPVKPEKSSVKSDKSPPKLEKSPVKTEKKKKLSLESTSSQSFLSSDSCGEVCIKVEKFPEDNDAAGMVQCPIYYPSEEQFKDPILYIQNIQSEAEQYGMCKIVPPCGWKMESREMPDFRFTTQIQCIHKMFHKWSPITEQLEYIKKLHRNSGHDDFHVPQIGGVEIDLVKLYELVQKYGGLKGIMGKEKKWAKIADSMKIPKQADRISKLYAAYCKYLLSYETLSDEETKRLSETVETERHDDELEMTEDKTLPEYYRCVYKGRSQLMSVFNRAARNSQLVHGNEGKCTPDEIEENYWKIVEESDDHVSAQCVSLDTSIYGSMFPVRRDNQYARHGWNLHNFVEGKGSILHHLGLIAGVTVPTLHISMMYSSKCFSCNNHNLPTVQYLHQGDGIVWYAVPSHEAANLKSALKTLMPKFVREKGFSLQHDSFMIPPWMLQKHGISLRRCVQTEREFVVVFPSVTYSNVSLGHNMSESVHYGTQDWIPDGYTAAQAISVNRDVELFSMDALLVFLARDSSTPDTTLALLLPYLEKVVEREVLGRRALIEAGLKDTERLLDKVAKTSQKSEVLEEINICDESRKICYLSVVLNSHENYAFSLEEGLSHIQKRKNLKHCKLMYRYSEEELKSLLRDVKSRLRGSNSSSPATASPKRKTRKSTSDVKVSPCSSNSSK